MKKRYLLIVLVAFFGVVFWLLYRASPTPSPINTDIGTEHALAPESPPAQKDDLIVVNTPLPHAVVASPLLIKGSARGGWYFEGSFPVSLIDATGTVLASGPASAQGDWMTAEYVPFAVTLTFVAPVTHGIGYLILKKDNPSGKTQYDDSLEIPVTL